MSTVENLSSKRSVSVDGEKLRKVRQALRWTQAEAGSKAGYSARLIRKMEGGGPVSRASLDNIVTAYREGVAQDKSIVWPTILRANDFVICTPKDALERVACTWFDRIFNQRDLTAVDDMVHPEVTLVAEGQTLNGRGPVRERLRAILEGFNPLRLCIEHLFTDGSTVIIYWQVDGTHSGTFQGIPATGREIFIRGSTMSIIRDDQFVEARDHYDVKHLFDQLLGTSVTDPTAENDGGNDTNPIK